MRSRAIARTLVGQCAFRRFAPSFMPGASLFWNGVVVVGKTRTRMRRENEIAFPSATAIAGEGDHWSSRSERTVVEGAPDAELRFRCRRFSSQEEAS